MTILRATKLLLPVLLASLLFAGCASKEKEPPIESTEQAYYQGAKKALDRFRFEQAVQLLEELESRYPFGRYAEQAQLDLIYAHYRSSDYEGARAAADRFLRLHPDHEQIDYVIYMRGLASFEKGRGVLDRFLPTDTTKRDPGAANEAIADFALLLSRFPKSDYAADARARLIHLRNRLAGYEIHVARYYLKRLAFVAAANRGRYVVENYQQTPYVADGLAVMIEAYSRLGMTDLAEQSREVLALNYPDYPALGANGSFNINRTAVGSRRSILNIMTLGLLGKSKDQ